LFATIAKQYVDADKDSFKRSMDELSAEAAVNGLTEDILQSILNDE